MGWAVWKAGGPQFDKLVVTTVGGSQLGWAFMRALNSTVSNGEFFHPPRSSYFAGTDRQSSLLWSTLPTLLDTPTTHDRPGLS